MAHKLVKFDERNEGNHGYTASVFTDAGGE